MAVVGMELNKSLFLAVHHNTTTNSPNSLFTRWGVELKLRLAIPLTRGTLYVFLRDMVAA
jgi:hypothetical protein